MKKQKKPVREGRVTLTQLFKMVLKRQCIFCIMKEKLFKEYGQTLHGINQKVSTRLFAKKEKSKKTNVQVSR